MPKFAVVDHVERIGSPVPEYLRSGVIIRVIPNDQGLGLFNEYEVNFRQPSDCDLLRNPTAVGHQTESLNRQLC